MRKREGGKSDYWVGGFWAEGLGKVGARREGPPGGEGSRVRIYVFEEEEGGRAGVCGVLGNAWEKRRKFLKKSWGSDMRWTLSNRAKHGWRNLLKFC